MITSENPNHDTRPGYAIERRDTFGGPWERVDRVYDSVAAAERAIRLATAEDGAFDHRVIDTITGEEQT